MENNEPTNVFFTIFKTRFSKGNLRTLFRKFPLSFELKLKVLLEIWALEDSWEENFDLFFSIAFIY